MLSDWLSFPCWGADGAGRLDLIAFRQFEDYFDIEPLIVEQGFAEYIPLLICPKCWLEPAVKDNVRGVCLFGEHPDCFFVLDDNRDCFHFSE